MARDEIGEESYADFKKYDVGDILGIKGKVFKTQTGEISIHAQEVTLLSKSLHISGDILHLYLSIRDISPVRSVNSCIKV